MSASDPVSDAPGEPVAWTGAGPVSLRFDDVYFSAEDGLAESRAVFLQGCGLPDRWQSRLRFTVGEIGFGTGLNVLALLQLWADRRPSPHARLSIFSVEGFPLAPPDAARALEAWPELAALAEPLLAAWPKGRRGLHRYDWPDLGATLDLMIGEGASALAGWTGRADAWFLDGFAPSKNPDLWSEAILAAVAERSAPGAIAATFTVAGAVRRGLSQAGFRVDKRPGHGRKKERLEAVFPGEPPADPPSPSVAVIGAGIAGAALARALQRQGCAVTVVEAERPAAGASGNAAALVTPRLDAGGGAVAQLHAQAFARAVQIYDAGSPDAVIARGALQLEQSPKDAGRFARIAAFDGFEPGAVALQPALGVMARLHEPSAPAGLALSQGRVIEPEAVVSAWLAGATVVSGTVARIVSGGGGFILLDTGGRIVAAADRVVIAAGAGGLALAPGLTLSPVRGQASTIDIPFTGEAAAWGGYAIPTRTGVLFGASHGRGDRAVDLRPSEAADNLARLAQGRPDLAARAAAHSDAPRSERAAVRVMTPDHGPVAGALPQAPGLFILSGLGGRGFTLAPLLAEHVAALIAGAPSPLPAALQALVSPGRARVQEPAGGGAVPPPPGPPASSQEC